MDNIDLPASIFFLSDEMDYTLKWLSPDRLAALEAATLEVSEGQLLYLKYGVPKVT